MNNNSFVTLHHFTYKRHKNRSFFLLAYATYLIFMFNPLNNGIMSKASTIIKVIIVVATAVKTVVDAIDDAKK